MSSKTSEGRATVRTELSRGALCDVLGELLAHVDVGRRDGACWAIGFIEARFGLDNESVRTARDLAILHMEIATGTSSTFGRKEVVVEFDNLQDALTDTIVGGVDWGNHEYVPTVEAVRGDGTVVRSFWWKTVGAAMAAVDEVAIASEGLGDWTVYPAIVAYPGGSADGEEEVADEAAYLRGEVEDGPDSGLTEEENDRETRGDC